jgi:hypothetical protein
MVIIDLDSGCNAYQIFSHKKRLGKNGKELVISFTYDSIRGN